MAQDSRTYSFGIALFPGITMIDYVGPYEVFSRVPGAKVHLVAESLQAIKTEFGTLCMPNCTWEELDKLGELDVLVVPGGPGINALLIDSEFKKMLQAIAAKSRFVASVCTGSLVLASAGLLEGYKATTHWRYLDLLQKFNVELVRERVVIDRDRITGGGITAGIDFGFIVVKELCGERLAKSIQLRMEYAPLPPFACGSPGTADSETLAEVTIATAALYETRKNIIDQLIWHNV